MAQYQGVFPSPQAPAGAYDSSHLTAESQQHLDTSTPDLQSPGSKKPSLIEKIKDKTQKLKSKVKKELHHRTADKDTTTTGTAAGHESSSSSSEDESEKTPRADQVPYSQLPKQGDPVLGREYTPSSTPSGREGGVDLQEDPEAFAMAESRASAEGSSSDFISPFRNSGPANTLQAVPTHYFYKEPRAASFDPPTEEDTRHRQQHVPSAAGLESVAVAPAVAGLAGNSALPTSTSRDYHTGVLDDSATRGPFPTDQEEFKGSAAAHRDDLPFTERLKEAAAAAGSAETAKHHLAGESCSDENKPYSQRATEGLTNAKDRVVGAVTPGSETEPYYDQYEDKPFTERAKDNLTSAKDTVVGAAYGTGGQNAYSEQKPLTERATEGLYNAKDAAVGAAYGAKDRLTGDTTSSTFESQEQKPYTEQAKDGVYAAKDTVVGAAQAAKDKVTGNTTNTDTYSYGDQKPLTEQAKEGIYNVKDTIVGAVTPQEQKPYTERAKEGIYDAKDTVVDAATPQEQKPYTERVKEGIYDVKDRVVGAATPQEQKPYTERAKEGIYDAKDTVVGAATPQEQKPYTERAMEGIYDVKDRVVGAVTPQEQKPYTERAKEGIYSAKDNVAGAVTPQEQKPYTERMKETIVGAKDSVLGTADDVKNQTAGATTGDGYGDQKPYTERAKDVLVNAKDRVVDTTYDAKDTVVGATQGGAGGAQGTSLTDRFSALVGGVGSKVGYYPTEEPQAEGLPGSSSPGAERKSWGEWALDKQGVTTRSGSAGTGYGTESIPPSDAGKSWTEKTKETLSGVAGTVGSKLGYGSGTQGTSPSYGSVAEESTVAGEQKPLTQRVQESAISAKDVIASKLGYSPSATSETGKPVSDTVNEGVQQAKDSATVTKEAAAARFHPDEHDKDLSERITSTLGGLGLGGSSPRGATTAPATYPTDAENKGILGRVTDSVSSLLWKKPAASGEEQDAPANHFTEGVKQMGEGFQQTSRNVVENTEA